MDGLSGLSGLSALHKAGGGGGGGDPIGDALRADVKGYWKMDEASGNRLDSSGNGHHAIPINGVTQAAGKIGNSAAFAAASLQYLRVPAHADLAGGPIDFTIVAQIYINNLNNVSNIVAKGEDLSVEYELFVNTSSGGITFTLSGDRSRSIPAGEFASTGVWVFVAAWYEHVAPYTIYLQIDEGSILSNSADGLNPNVTVDPTANMLIGTVYELEPYDFLNGRADEVGFWQRILTADERSYLFNSGDGRSLY